MSNKKSFVFHEIWFEVIKAQTNEVQLELYQAISEYGLTGNCGELSAISNIAFSFIKPQIDRDKEKYDAIVERNRENGKFGGRPKKPNKPSGLFGNPKNLDIDIDIDNDNDNESENDLKKLSPDFSEKKIDLKSVFEIISEDKDWINTVSKNNKFKTETTTMNYLENFYLKLKNEGVLEKSISDTKSHFARWFNKELEKLRN